MTTVKSIDDLLIEWGFGSYIPKFAGSINYFKVILDNYWMRLQNVINQTSVITMLHNGAALHLLLAVMVVPALKKASLG